MRVGAESRLPRARRDRRHGGLRPRADPAAGAPRRPRRRRPGEPRGGRPGRAVGRDLPMRVVPVARPQPRRVGARRAVARAARWRASGCDLIHSLASTAPLRSRARRITTIHDLNYKLVPEAHFGVRALGMRVLVPAAARALAPDHRRRRQSRGATSAEHLGTPAGKVDVVPLGVTPRAAGRADAGGRAARAARRSATARSCSRVSAKRPHKNLAAAARRASPRSPASAARCSCCPATRRRTRPSCARAPPTLGRATRSSPRGCPAEDLEGLYALAGAFVFPSLCEGFGLPGARGDGARRAGGLLGPQLAARGGRRRGAALRSRGSARRSPPRVERLLGDPAEAERLRAAGRERVGALHAGSGPRS